MSKFSFFCGLLAALPALAWNASTAWQWDTAARADIPEVCAADANTETLGPLGPVARTGTASGFSLLEARVADPVWLMEQIFRNAGFTLFIR